MKVFALGFSIQIDIWQNDWRKIKLGKPNADCETCAKGNFEFLEAKMRIFSPRFARMHGHFGSHREATAGHVGRLAGTLTSLGANPARGKSAAVGAGAALRARAATIGGMDFGAMARDAFVFEHLEIAQAHLIEQLADRAGHAPVAAVAREIREEDEAMAATISRNWTNVLSLALATRGLPTRRPAEDAR